MIDKSNGRKEDLVLVLRTGAKHLALGADCKMNIVSISGRIHDEILLMTRTQFETRFDGRKAPHIGQQIVFWERITQDSPVGDDNGH